ncbi:pleckstrin homology domain-containing family J member 1 isoform X2 [Lagopus muta]|uniref:pleckstrin homology domain-containing family J member 1 isoform X2 n=1 Tax=Lagopus muta TaxID=64668 RepID=UPI00209D1C74|nr:pleckstrin homology domain-containing family J member 1 isoform X2 [Lagopus muta]
MKLSPLERCCWSTAESPKKRRMFSPSNRSCAGICFLLCTVLNSPEPPAKTGFIEEPERKYCFECDSEEQCQEWIEALKRASYEFMRRSLIFYRNEIQKMTGKDPLEQFGISEEARFQLASRKQ